MHPEQRLVRLITLKLIPFLVLLYLVAYVDRSAVGFAKLHMAADVGIGDAAYGFGAGLFFIGYFLFEVPSNLLLDKVGARRWFARILLTWGAITVCMALIQGPMNFYVLRFSLGLAEAGFFPGVLYYITQWYPVRHRAKVLGLFILSQPLALLLTGPLAGGLLGMDGVLGLHGWQWLFIVIGTPAMLLAWPTLRWLPDSPDQVRWLSDEQRGWLKAQLAQDLREYGQTRHASPLHALKDRRTLLLALYYLPSTLSIYGLALWLPTLVHEFGTSDLVTGLISAVPYLFGVVGLLLVPRSAQHFDERYGHLGMMTVIGALGLAMAASVASPVLQLMGLCVAAFGLFAYIPLFWTLPGRCFAGASAAAGIALINALGNLGGYLGPFAIGLLKQYTGSLASGLYLLAGVQVFALVLTFGVRRVLERHVVAQAGYSAMSEQKRA